MGLYCPKCGSLSIQARPTFSPGTGLCRAEPAGKTWLSDGRWKLASSEVVPAAFRRGEPVELYHVRRASRVGRSMKLHGSSSGDEKAIGMALGAPHSGDVGDPGSRCFAARLRSTRLTMAVKNCNKHGQEEAAAGRRRGRQGGRCRRQGPRYQPCERCDRLSGRTPRRYQRFVADHAALGATVYTDDFAPYKGMDASTTRVCRHTVGPSTCATWLTRTGSSRFGRS